MNLMEMFVILLIIFSFLLVSFVSCTPDNFIATFHLRMYGNREEIEVEVVAVLKESERQRR